MFVYQAGVLLNLSQDAQRLPQLHFASLLLRSAILESH